MMLLDVVIDPIAVRGDRWFLGRIFYYVEEGAYFGVPLVNFAGWALVGTLAIGGYLVLTRDARGTRPEPGMALYYAVLAFNLVGTAWIREGVLLGLGLLLHAVTAAELVARRKYVYLCTNAILLKEKLEEGLFTPSKYLSFSVHMDGLREEHDEAVCREGVYDQAVEGIRAALRRGFRVTTNTTLFDGASAIRMQMFFDEMMDLRVEGMMLSTGYSYSKAPDQEHFLLRQ